MKNFKLIFKKVIDFFNNLTGDNVSIYAAQASFFLVISAIPMIMLILTVMSRFINIDITSLHHAINAFAPAEVTKLLSTIVNELFSKTSSISLISISAISALWAASKGIMALYTGLNSVYHAPTRNWFYSRFFSVLYTLAFIATLTLTIIFFGFGEWLESYFYGRAAILAEIIHFFLNAKIIIFMIYLTFLFALFYKFLPKREHTFKSQLPGAAVAAIGWMGFSFIYSLYIENFTDFSYVYGSLAAVVLLMVWLYFCMNIFLYGAQINKMLENGFFKK